MNPEQRAEQLAAEGKCIICNAPAEALQRGLCERHRGRFKAAIAKISPEKRPEFEADLIEQGMLLPNRKGQKLRPEDDEFPVALGKFQAKTESGAAPLADVNDEALAQQLAADLRGSAAPKEAAPKGKKKMSK